MATTTTTTDWIKSTCTKLCNPEEDIHDESCIKHTFRIMECQYCCDGDDCMICGRQGKEIKQ